MSFGMDVTAAAVVRSTIDDARVTVCSCVCTAGTAATVVGVVGMVAPGVGTRCVG